MIQIYVIIHLIFENKIITITEQTNQQYRKDLDVKPSHGIRSGLITQWTYKLINRTKANFMT